MPSVRTLALAVVLVAAGALVAGPSRADVSVAPAADGHLGAWLVAGPLAAGATHDPADVAPSKAEARPGAPGFRLLAGADGALDLDQALGTGKKAGATALVGGVLEVREPLDGWLLLSADGAVRIWIDGKPLWQRAVRRLRAGSWDALALRLEPGAHRLLMRLEHPGEHWAFALRVLDARDLGVPPGLELRLPGATDRDASGLARDLLTCTLDAGLGSEGYAPRVSLEYRRGAPRLARLPVALALRGRSGPLLRVRAGDFPFGPRGTHPFEVSLPRLGAAEPGGELELHAEVGPAKLGRRAPAPERAPAAAARARQLLEQIAAGKGAWVDAEVVRATLEHRVAELERAVTSEHRGDASAELGRLEALGAALAQGRDPLNEVGRVSIARRSPVDGEPDPSLVHVPAAFSRGQARRWPLVVALHGLNGTPDRIVDAFLDSKSSGPVVDGFVVAPYAHGNAFYRGPGEVEVLATLDWMLARYPIDPERVSITGVSMGGTGAAHLGLRYADRFSAAAPLCGYHSFFVRRDVKDRPIRPWELERMHHWSPASFAERGRNLPMWVAHGTKDHPLENSKVLVERYRKLGYSMTDEWPDTGHDVWTKAYAGARLFSWLARQRRAAAPTHVSLKTDALRFGRQDWVTVTRLARSGHAGQVDAVVSKPERVTLHTADVHGVELERRAGLISPAGAVEVEVDGATLGFSAGEAIALVKDESGGWQKGSARDPRGKRAGVEGPIRDAFLGPLTFVYGSGRPATERANREVAFAFARMRNGPDARYRVIADRELDATLERDSSLVLVGTPADHRLLAEIGAALPLRVENDTLRVGDDRFAERGTGATFVFPNPRHPDRTLVVITGVDAAGIWRALSLPALLPDFIAYDEALAPAAGEQVLGSAAKVLAAGFFDRQWRLPAERRDPQAAP